MKITSLLIPMIFFSVAIKAQVGIGTANPNQSAALDIVATGKGLLIPRMDSVTRVAIQPPLPDGLMVFQTDNRKGFWYAVDNAWIYVPDQAANGDNLGNHTMMQPLNLQNQSLVGANAYGGIPGNNGIRIDGAGRVGISAYFPAQQLQIGDATFSKPSFLRFATGNGNAYREWETGINVNPNNLNDVSGENYSFAIRDATANATRLLIDYATGDVGIGMKPQEKLDVAGTARAQQFIYSAPQPNYLSIPLDAFSSDNPPLYQAFKNVVSAASGFFPAELWLTRGTAGLPGFVTAPVYLPQGATLTSLELTAIDNDGTLIAPLVNLSGMRNQPSGTLVLVNLNVNAALTTESPNWQTVSAPLNHIVQNNMYTYKLAVRLNQNSSGTKLFGVRIAYTVERPD